MEWVEQGQVTSVQRLKLATIENNQGRVQFGEQAPMVTSRSVRGGRPDGGGFGGGGGFPVAESISYMDLGTMLTVTARCEGQRDIIAQIDLQRSSFAPHKAAEKAEGQEPVVPTTPRKLSSTLSTCVRLVAGEPVVLSSQQNSQGDVSTESWVVVIAHKQ
jgi:type II secretory pathway component GspD/PulD (secretin)